LAEAIGLTTTAFKIAAVAVLGVVAALAALKIAFYIANEARRKEIEYN
jgi:ribose/xylose/arabinose/galactoside ABC-type transport system permease subunit